MNIKNKMLCAVSAIAIGSMAPSIASAGAYDFALTLKGQNQVNYVQTIIKNYERSMPLYERLISNYGHYSWAQSFRDRLQKMKDEVAQLQSILDQRSEPIPVEVGKETVWSQEFDVVKKGVEKLVDTRIRQIEEETDGMIRVYEELTRIFEREDIVRRYRGRVIYTIYSNGERVPFVNPLMLSKNTRVETREENERKFIREYAVVVPEEEEPVNEFGTPTVGVLTAQEYRDRDDVIMSGTENYSTAALTTNSGINPDYINRESGLAPYADSLGFINAPEAWAKGWTGKGTTIAILDTGIDMDHPEFADKIVDAKCFVGTCSSSETIHDGHRDSHGTHVAGIAAANLDGVGTTGVAPDADLLIAKTAFDSGFYDFDAANRAIAWAVDNGADVINMSGGVNYGWMYKNTFESNGDGTYYSTTDVESYKTGGYNNMLNSSQYRDFVEVMKNHDAVVVMAAGNQGTDVADMTSQYVAQTDEDGNHVTDGRVIIAGMYDVRLGGISRHSSKAGTLCFDKEDGGSTCDNGYRVSDWYLMAPGMNVAAPDANGGYRINSGTSMAAPMISGGVALIRQMWPHMSGDNVVKLMLDTADKSIPGYDENIHGQGLMDLDNATSPQGVVGIPTTGRIDGNVSSINTVQGMSIAGASISALDNMMVVDDYDRDFYVNGNNFNVGGSSLSSYTQGAMVSVPFENMKVDLGENNFGVSANYDGITFGVMSEKQTFLGNYANNQLIDVDGSSTVFMGYDAEYNVGSTTFYGGASLGVTSLNVNSSAMMKKSDALVSNSAKFGLNHGVGNGVFKVSAEMPIAIVKGDAEFEVASGVSSIGSIESMTMKSSLANEAREIRYGIGYDFNMSDNSMIGSYVNLVDNAGSISGNTSSEIGINFKVSF